MSLTSFLKNRKVREKFLKEFPKIPFKLKPKKEILAPPITNRYGLVGTAFDYLLRFYLKRSNPKAITRPWIAESVEVKMSIPKAKTIISEAKKIYLQYLKSGKMNKKLFRSSILLAQLDTFKRSGYIDDNLGNVDDRDIKDLKKLVSVIDPKLFKAKKLTILNPNFGKGSEIVGGADADLLIDNTLIDIKTTMNLRLRREWFNQIIGYYILSKIGGIYDASPNHKINNLGFYFSRYGEIYTIPIKTVINERKLSSFIKWFVKTAIENKLFNTVEEDEEKGICYYKFEYEGGSLVSFTEKIGKKKKRGGVKKQ